MTAEELVKTLMDEIVNHVCSVETVNMVGNYNISTTELEDDVQAVNDFPRKANIVNNDYVHDGEVNVKDDEVFHLSNEKGGIITSTPKNKLPETSDVFMEDMSEIQEDEGSRVAFSSFIHAESEGNDDKIFDKTIDNAMDNFSFNKLSQSLEDETTPKLDNEQARSFLESTSTQTDNFYHCLCELKNNRNLVVNALSLEYPPYKKYKKSYSSPPLNKKWETSKPVTLEATFDDERHGMTFEEYKEDTLQEDDQVVPKKDNGVQGKSTIEKRGANISQTFLMRSGGETPFTVTMIPRVRRVGLSRRSRYTLHHIQKD